MSNVQAISLLSYTDLLNEYAIAYRDNGPWVIVGEPAPYAWTIVLSVRVAQCVDLLHKLLPVFREKAMAFQIIRGQEEHYQLNGGNYGHDEIGKAILLFPATEEQAKEIIHSLASLPETFEGVGIKNGIRLGKIMYALATDQASPAPPCPFPIKKRYRYKPIKGLLKYYFIIEAIKLSQKGDVYVGAHVFRWKSYILKQGRPNAGEDETGRDMVDRLNNEKAVLKNLRASIGVPKLIDFFKRQGYYYLVMTYFEGPTLRETITNWKELSWKDMRRHIRLKVLTWYSNALQIVKKLHENGHVHRDISDINFICLPDGSLRLIDFEIAYRLGQLEAPFFFGHPGFAAPEQYQRAIPTIKEDIYSLGALLAYMVTGIAPANCISTNSADNKRNLYKHTKDDVIANLIVRCLDASPPKRPTINDMIDIITTHSKSIGAAPITYQKAI